MGRVAKGAVCSVVGCDKAAVRSVSHEWAEEARMDARSTGRAYLCREHYKELKRRLRKRRRLELMRYKGVG
ncbi:TPA: hypothetical protein EYP44_05065 [Candidatus Bathyarchaeota archaeon]|nr:hypothetical protein [Candidatus Bathyarchaeota archaeon]